MTYLPHSHDHDHDHAPIAPGPRSLLVALGVLGLFGLVLWVASRSVFVADETEFALVSTFGRIDRVLGDEPGETGLHLKRPWQSVLRVDRRTRLVEPAAREVLTADKSNLEVAPLALYRVTEPALFLRAAGTIAAAETRLEERLAAALGLVLARHPMSALASADSSLWKLDAVTDELAAEVRPALKSELGIDLVDLRLRRFNHPLEVRPSVFELIRSERRQVAARLRAEADSRYRTIVADAEREADALLADADAQAARLRSEAEADATRQITEAYSLDPNLARFLQDLDAINALLDSRSTLVLSTESPWLRLLREGTAPPAPASGGASP